MTLRMVASGTYRFALDEALKIPFLASFSFAFVDGYKGKGVHSYVFCNF
jgi:hypothetical protein